MCQLGGSWSRVITSGGGVAVSLLVRLREFESVGWVRKLMSGGFIGEAERGVADGPVSYGFGGVLVRGEE